MSSRKCKKCGLLFPETDQYFYYVTAKNGKKYLKHECKSCTKLRIKTWNESNPERSKKRRKDYYWSDVNLHKEQASVWQSENKEKRREQRKKWADNNREKNLASKKKWSDNNPDKHHIYSLKRRELKKNIDVIWTSLMGVCLKSFQPACVVCGGTYRLAIDHVLPLSKGHPLEPGNAVRLCVHCNRKKWNHALDDLPEGWKEKILKAAEEFRVAWSGGF